MDIQRLILYAIFFSSAFFLWSAWQQEHAPPPPPVTQAPPAAIPGGAGSVPAPAPVPAPSTAAPPAGSVPAAAPGAVAAAGPKVTITTDLYTAEIDTVGGVISLISLAKHQDATDPKKPYLVLQRNADRVFIAQAGLIGEGWPNHETRWEVLPGPHELAPGSERVELRLQATTPDGSKVVQILTFHRGSYLIDVAFDITNATGQPITPEAYFQITRDTKHAVVQSSMAPASYIGPVVHSENKKFEKVDFGEIDKMVADPNRKPKYEATADNGWVGMIEHYFVAAWVPPQDRAVQRRFYTTKAGSGLYTAGVRFSEGTIAPGAAGELRASLYVGPQDQDVLAKTAKGLDLVVDYGIFTVLAVPLFVLLKWLHGIIGNWGWAIVVMTIMIKAVFYPLNAAAARSMAKMKIIAPKMKALQEQYANDKQQLQIKMMEMYKTEKINPLGGCLPIVVQIPVFIALYWVLLSAVELRQAPWILWIHDLSAPDPYYVLPVIYAITAYLQVKLSPTPITDPVQARVMQIMPIAFSVLFIFFPSGLVLYWLVNNILQIAQQWHMNRLLEREAAAKAAKRR
jgi:YidC/Oxa1 family membrane protein insertase